MYLVYFNVSKMLWNEIYIGILDNFVRKNGCGGVVYFISRNIFVVFLFLCFCYKCKFNDFF